MIRKYLLLGVAALLLGACGSDDEPGRGSDADTGDSGRPGFDSGSESDGGSDAGIDDPDGAVGADTTDGGSGSDAAEDTIITPDVDVPDVDPSCDQDRDGFLNAGCGGNDCDDDNQRINPGQRDVCDFEDNNCNGDLNEDQDCSVYAHTSGELFLVDPFTFDIEQIGTVPGILDFDTTIDGDLYGITSDTLWRYDDSGRQWEEAGDLGSTNGQANGFAIDSRGIGYITAGSDVLRVNLETGLATRIGSMGVAPNGNDFESSGDCVINKDDSLFMTSRHTSDTDTLVFIDPSGAATEVGTGTSHDSIFGLTAAYGYMFGFTSSGQLIEIDEGTGESRLLHTFSGRVWYGAASSPAR